MPEAHAHESSMPSGVRRVRITESATDRPMASLVLGHCHDPASQEAVRDLLLEHAAVGAGQTFWHRGGGSDAVLSVLLAGRRGTRSSAVTVMNRRMVGEMLWPRSSNSCRGPMTMAGDSHRVTFT